MSRTTKEQGGTAPSAGTSRKQSAEKESGKEVKPITEAAFRKKYPELSHSYNSYLIGWNKLN